MEASLRIPPQFSGAAQIVLFTRYGDPTAPGFELRWISSWEISHDFPWFPQRHIFLHKHFRPLLEHAFRELEGVGLHEEILSFDGAFDIRMVKGSETLLSTHSWGCAIDLNAAECPFGDVGTWSEEFLRIMTTNDIFCGQHWTGRKDPMHFAMVDG